MSASTPAAVISTEENVAVPVTVLQGLTDAITRQNELLAILLENIKGATAAPGNTNAVTAQLALVQNFAASQAARDARARVAAEPTEADIEFAKLFCDLSMSAKEIAAILGYQSQASVYSKAKALGLPTRTDLYGLEEGATVSFAGQEIAVAKPATVSVSITDRTEQPAQLVVDAHLPSLVSKDDHPPRSLSRDGRKVMYERKNGILIVSGRPRHKLPTEGIAPGVVGMVRLYNEWCDDPRATLDDIAKALGTGSANVSLAAGKLREDPSSVRSIGQGKAHRGEKVQAPIAAAPAAQHPAPADDEEDAPDKKPVIIVSEPAKKAEEADGEDELDLSTVDPITRLKSYDLDKDLIAWVGTEGAPTALQLLAVLDNEEINSPDYPILTGADLAQVADFEWQDAAKLSTKEAEAIVAAVKARFDDKPAPVATAQTPPPAVAPQPKPTPAPASPKLPEPRRPVAAAGKASPPQPAPKQMSAEEVAAFMAAKAARNAGKREALGNLVGDLDLAAITNLPTDLGQGALMGKLQAMGYHHVAQPKPQDNGIGTWAMMHPSGSLFLFERDFNGKISKHRFAVQVARLDNVRFQTVSCMLKEHMLVNAGDASAALNGATVTTLLFNAGDLQGPPALAKAMAEQGAVALVRPVATQMLGMFEREARQQMFAPGARGTVLKN